MIGTRSFRSPSPSTAALVRFVAFLVATIAVVTIPTAFVAAAAGHSSIVVAVGSAAGAVALALAAATVARSLDPMRR